VQAAGLKLHGEGVGDIALRLVPEQKIAYLFLWPHVRPWHFSRPEPTLRCVAGAESVAQMLGRALAGAASVPVQPVSDVVPQRNPARGAAAAVA
jgi:hypothetical protein